MQPSSPELGPNGEIKAAPVKASFGPTLDTLPLGRRYGGVIEREALRLRASGPKNVDILGARWSSPTGPLAIGDDPLAIDITHETRDHTFVCVMDVPDRVCVATWPPRIHRDS
ncbi:MAG: hypothetical protein ACKV2T_17755 [Kofleriaceae bacterium]